MHIRHLLSLVIILLLSLLAGHPAEAAAANYRPSSRGNTFLRLIYSGALSGYLRPSG